MAPALAEITARAQTLTVAGDLAGAQRVLARVLNSADTTDPRTANPDLALAAALHARVLIALGDAHGARLWAGYAHAAVRYRDPGDPDRHLIDISLSPHPGPLRRELLAHLDRVGEATVTELRTFALTETVYRAADATRVLHTLADSGAVTRRPATGRLGGDVVISTR